MSGIGDSDGPRGRIVVATGNAGKLEELARLLDGVGRELVTQRALGIDGAAETAPTFVENALAKARHASRLSGLPAIADDSGLVVDALGGAPGVHSARYAGRHGDDAANNARLLAALERTGDTSRAARFVCVAVYLPHAEHPLPAVCEGIWEGVIARAPAGGGGFGYDPLFVVPGLGRTAAKLDAVEKDGLSHRGTAVRGLRSRMAAYGCGGGE